MLTLQIDTTGCSRSASAKRFIAKIFACALVATPMVPEPALAVIPIVPSLRDNAPSLVEQVQRRGGFRGGAMRAGGGIRGGAVARPRGGAIARRGYVGPRSAAVRRGYVARGPRGNVVAGRRTTVVRPGYRPYRPVPVRPWVRPANYWWHPGMAVAAGAAIGFVGAAAATAYATSPAPGPGYCWYYSNPQRTQGFWDVCP